MENNELLYLIALKSTPMVGDITAKKLISHLGSAEAIFKEKKSNLKKIYGIGTKLLENLTNPEFLQQAENELLFIEKNNIKIVTFTDNNYPEYLKQCIDAPILYYQKGNINLKNKYMLSIVGTRNVTPYGTAFCEKLVSDLAHLDVVIVSGFAYGVDIVAHKSAIKNNLQTIGCLAHGLQMIYPSSHQKYADEVLENGGFITDFSSQSTFDRKNFLRRNRIIAGLSQATVVIESGAKGGSLVTADLAFSYDRDVFATPGRATDTYSIGCNELIRREKARILLSADDLLYYLNWDTPEQTQKTQVLDFELLTEEKTIYDYLKKNGKQLLDSIAIDCKMPVYEVSNLLFQLEMKNAVRPLPGKLFEVI